MHISTFCGPISFFARCPKVNVLSIKPLWRFAVMSENNNGNVQKVLVMDAKSKSVIVAFILAFIFGPLGMFYVTTSGAIIMMVVSLAVGVITFGFGLVVTWPICVIWACIAASNQNKKAMAAFAGA